MLYEVIHSTKYQYEAPVSQCLNEVHLTPRVLPTQAVKGAILRVEPAPAFVYERKDYFGNDVSTFGVFETHEKLTATARSLVDVTPSGVAIIPEDWEIVRGQIASQSDEACLDRKSIV